ncbi:hypothetical protein XBJ2_170011 [Xenorhabdus bovienii str. Jollieti]|uniref:Uncharacterized protein n=1 Tax=Xenorhabdus bovienii (strain SS-2004) TaxID=406818 RepID=D3UZA0_XENBS|nr:hypothetical protein XBJ1_0538 [Xenorhabdus bovienii SS-2004]CDH28219.1 hypothetical protein XBJ2_170011 [Xenorhabdus bovienii str. Jollieti]
MFTKKLFFMSRCFPHEGQGYSVHFYSGEWQVKMIFTNLMLKICLVDLI